MMKRIVLFSILFIYFSCNLLDSTPTSPEEKLAIQYCSSCHLYTPPELLDKGSWMKVLNVMKEKIELTGTPLPKTDWNTIFHFYYSSAPFALNPVSIDTSELKIKEIDLIELPNTKDVPPYISSLSLYSDTLLIGTTNGDLFSKNVSNEDNTIYKSGLGVPVQLTKDSKNKQTEILSMGELGPHHEAKGTIYQIDGSKIDSLNSKMNRPIHFTKTDLNGDSHDEYIVSHFGSTNDDKETGGLWIYNIEDGYQGQNLAPYTGATKSITVDLNKDGLIDVVALFSQGDERIIAFMNKGNLEFEETPLLRFHPLFGSLDFELKDIDNDNDFDIILVNGDNADYSPILKPYHGFRIFENKGESRFNEKVFHHINGASKILDISDDSGNSHEFGILALYADLYSRPWEILNFIKVNQDFESDRFYNSKIKGNHWVVATKGKSDSLGNLIVLGKNKAITKNVINFDPEFNSETSVLAIRY